MSHLLQLVIELASLTLLLGYKDGAPLMTDFF